MNTVTYEYECSYTGLHYKVRIDGVTTVTDEPYPPGGTLRVLRNDKGQILAGPLVEELVSFKVEAMS